MPVRLQLLRARPRRCRGSARAARRRPRSARGPRRRPRSSSRGRSGPSAAMIGPVAADLAQRAHALVDDPARERAPAAVQAATAPSAASRTGRQSATKTIAAASVERGRLAVLVRVRTLLGRRLGRAPHRRAVDLAPVTEARPRMADGSPSRRRFSATFSGASSVSSPRFSERTARTTRRRARSRTPPARAAGRQRSGRPPSGITAQEGIAARSWPRGPARGRRASRPSPAPGPPPTCGAGEARRRPGRRP